jgi:Tfp pilus assembly pilus retraction ATPase PilT
MINNVISSSSSEGMCLLDDSLLRLYREGLVDAATILPRFIDPEKARLVAQG